MAAVVQILDVNGNPVLVGRKYTIQRVQGQSTMEYHQNRMNMEGSDGTKTFTVVRTQPDRDGQSVVATMDNNINYRLQWFEDELYRFTPVQDGGRRKSRRLRRLRKSRKYRR